jgi:GT2 family glycosyltransferase
LAACKRRVLTLSIIIVSYNVKYFLEQCLHSVAKATHGIEAETIVVDNASSDNSIRYLKERFPDVHYIESVQNLGFAKACNLGLTKASGNYILFLNPDTLLAEDSLFICLDFFKTHPQAGSLGVRMIDGSGQFLPESKRSFPSPVTSFYKLTGLASLFPRSKRFGRYHLGYLPEHQNHEVDVLAGAYMLIPKAVLDHVGSFDETFFMYGEDVDLSYRIQKAGYKNYYVADTTIIHFKGESTKRGSLNYVKLFYQAMSIFVRKHYGGTKAGLFTFSIQMAIGLRGGLTALAKFIKWIGLPVIDAILILLCFFLIKNIWATYVRPDVPYSNELVGISFLFFTLLYLVVAYYAGLYNRYYRRQDLVGSTFMATLVILATYALLPEHLRFSRGILTFGAVLAFGVLNLSRWILVRAGLLQQQIGPSGKPYLLIAGTAAEFEEAKAFLDTRQLSDKVIGRIAVNLEDKTALTDMAHISTVHLPLHATELIFCAGKYSYKAILAELPQIKANLRFRFHAAGSSSIVGSDSSGTSGEVLASESQFKLDQPTARRTKRLADVLISLFFLLTFPVHFLFVKKPVAFIYHCMLVLQGRRTWVGYGSPQVAGLPKLRKGILLPNGDAISSTHTIPADGLALIDRYYASDYDPLEDLRLIIKNYKHLGN